VPEERRDGPLVLLVDDNADLLQLAEAFLEHRGFHVVTAVDGERALHALDIVQPDIIITDMVMPILDGLTFMREYARRPPPHVPIIAVSSFAPYLDQALELGAAAVLQKPYDAATLTSLARSLIDGRAPPNPAPRADADEHARLQAVLDVELDRAEPSLQPFIDDVAAIFDVPVAGISAVTHDWQRLVMQCSSASPDLGTPREHAFCTHAVAARAALVIQDALDNPLFRSNPNVTERGFRFYAGVPLMPAQGEAVGTLCILDFRPHHFSYWDLELLGLLARRVLSVLEWRLQRRKPEVPRSTCRYLALVDVEFGIYGKALFADLVVVWASRAVDRREPVALAALAVPDSQVQPAIERLRSITVGGQIGRLGRHRLGVIAPGRTAKAALEAIRSVMDVDSVVVTVDLSHFIGAPSLALRHVEHGLGRVGLDGATDPDHPLA
jgi:CheY-like chemotaxis protein